MARTDAIGLSRYGAALWMVCGLAVPALAASAGLQPSGSEPSMNLSSDAGMPLFDFDLPAQPLAVALDRFAGVSGRSALFSSALVAGRTSSPVRGRYASKAALQRLLEGTGLDVEEVSAGRVTAFVLKPAGPQALAVPAPAGSSADEYDGLVQERVWEAVCSDPVTARTGYRSLLRFWVDAAGRIGRARLLGSTGDGQRDALLLRIVQQVRIDQSPPPDMAQPLTMLILPGQAGGPACDTRTP